jgi:hypothetical protein
VHDKVALGLAFLADFDEVVNVPTAAPCCWNSSVIKHNYGN